jgi:hypothetical protein
MAVFDTTVFYSYPFLFEWGPARDYFVLFKANIKLSWKCLSMKNALAYDAAVLITPV